MDINHPLRHPRRPFLVYLTDNINVVGDMASDTSKSLWEGLIREAAVQDCDVLAVICGNAHHPFPSRVHQQISAASGDGFICWISRDSQPGHDYFSRFEHSHLISMSQQHGQHPVVAIDNAPGIQNLFSHLASAHGCQRIAFVRGPLQHPYAEERFNAYCQAQAACGQPFDSRRVTPPGQWSWDTGVEAIRLLLDERKLGIPGELDAIMCASDRIAMGCIAELKKRGIRVPEDVAVTGFNFLLEARSSRPSLSTVATPFEQKSRLAVQWLLSSLRHSPAQPKALEPIVMLGESCGCLNPHAGAPVRLCIGTLADEADWASCRTALDSIFPLFRHASAQSPERIDTVVTALRTALARDNPSYFSEQILAQLDTGQYEFMDVQIWSDVLLTLRHHLRRYCTSTELLACAELALHQARLLMSDYFSRQEMQQRQQEHQRAGELRQLSAELVYCSDMAGIARVLAQQLPAIGVASAWVALFETAQAQAADQARLLIALERGELYPLPAAGFFYPAAQLLPEGYCQPAGRRNLLLHPLSDGENEFGFTIFEVGPTDGAVYESLAYGIGTAVKSVMLRENLRRRSEDLELSLENLTRAQNQLVEAEKMVALGELVAGIAHEINTPIGIGVTAISSIADASRSVQNALVARDAQAVRRGIATIAEGTELASRNLHRAADLIASFKQISVDQSSLQIRRFRLSAYIDDIIKSLGSWLKRGQHQVELDCQPDLEITCDPGAIAQIFTNLIQNSISYGFDTRQNGLIRIACRRSSAGVIIDYSDNGAGMSTEIVEKIFLPFFTTRRGKGGSGLGMHIVYNLVTQNLAGTIRCESQPGQGVRFHMVWTNC